MHNLYVVRHFFWNIHQLSESKEIYGPFMQNWLWEKDRETLPYGYWLWVLGIAQKWRFLFTAAKVRRTADRTLNTACCGRWELPKIICCGKNWQTWPCGQMHFHISWSWNRSIIINSQWRLWKRLVLKIISHSFS